MIFRHSIFNSFFSTICYVINCDTPKDTISILPENNRAEWGPGEDLTKVGLEPITYKDAIVEAEDKTLEVIFFVWFLIPLCFLMKLIFSPCFSPVSISNTFPNVKGY